MNLAFTEVTVTAVDLLSYADKTERPIVARLFKRVCVERQDFENAALFRDIEMGYPPGQGPTIKTINTP